MTMRFAPLPCAVLLLVALPAVASLPASPDSTTVPEAAHATPPANEAHPAPAESAEPDTVPVGRIGAPQAILAMTRGQAVLIDVRYESQRALGHVAGDLPMRFDRVKDEGSRLPKDKLLIFYCACAHEEEALEAARHMPHPDDPHLAVLVGGYEAWRRAGGKVVTEATWEGVFRVVDAPREWGKTPTEHGRCRYSRDSTVAAAGRSSGCVVCAPPDSGATSLPGFSQRLDAAPLVGRIVTFSAMVRTEHVQGAALLWLGTESAQGRLMSFARTDSIAVTGTQRWRPVAIQLAIPAGAERLDYGLQLIGAGKAWIDQATLTEEASAGKPRKRLAVLNPGFEQ